MKKLYMSLFIIVLSLNLYGLNFSVYPTGFNLDVTKTATEELTITNNTNEPLKVQIYPEADVNFGENYNLNKNIVVFPKTVALKPGLSQNVRFRIKPSSEIKEGEFKSLLTFKEIPSEIKNVEDENSEEMTSRVKFITELSISIYGKGENSVVDGEVKNVKLNYNNNGSVIISCDTLSKGNTALKLRASLEINDKDKATLNLGTSKREGDKNLTVQGEFKEGLKGKNATLKIFDQNGKEYYNKKLML